MIDFQVLISSTPDVLISSTLGCEHLSIPQSAGMNHTVVVLGLVVADSPLFLTVEHVSPFPRLGYGG
jgi:hypothetical protein